MTAVKRQKTSDSDDGYFKCYSDIEIHTEMLADKVRTRTYKLAILKNYQSIYGKVVLDVGCGTGILSLFCVQAGAKKVYAVEASDIATEAIKVIHSNNMQDKITVLHGKVEEIVLPEKVDVIVSEWMGYMLLYECMLPSVLYARDRWLKPDGVMLPSNATIYLSLATDESHHYNRGLLWDEMGKEYGVNLSPLKQYATKCSTEKAHIKNLDLEDVVATSVQILDINLNEDKVESALSVHAPFKLCCLGTAQVNCFVIWFDVHFPLGIQLTTSPYKENTHWQQAVFYLTDSIDVDQDTIISGNIVIKPNDKHKRCLDVLFTFTKDTSNEVVQKYVMDGILS